LPSILHTGIKISTDNSKDACGLQKSEGEKKIKNIKFHSSYNSKDAFRHEYFAFVYANFKYSESDSNV